MRKVSFRKTLSNDVVLIIAVICIAAYVGLGVVWELWIPFAPMLAGSIYSILSNVLTLSKMPYVEWDEVLPMFNLNKGDYFFNNTEHVYYDKIASVSEYGNVISLTLENDKRIVIELESCNVDEALEFSKFLKAKNG